MREEKILITGIEINYKITGEGKPLLILHGWGSNTERWKLVTDLLVKSGVKVIILDLPGFGGSQEPVFAWGLDDYCDFVQEFINRLSLEKFHLLGHSFGGALAVKCSLKFPQRIDKLFLVGAACFRRKAVRKRIFYIISKIFSFLPGYQFFRKAFYKFIVRRSDYLYTEGVMKEIYLKIIKKDLSDILPLIQIPTIIIWGEKDDVTPIKHAYSIKEKIKGSKLIIIPNAGHDLEKRETPASFLNKILENI